jgi:hypothetical protein
MYSFSFDQRGQATLGAVGVWMGGRRKIQKIKNHCRSRNEASRSRKNCFASY